MFSTPDGLTMAIKNKKGLTHDEDELLITRILLLFFASIPVFDTSELLLTPIFPNFQRRVILVSKQ